MISPQIENLVRMKVQQSNVMLASQPQPGQVPGRAEGGSAPGIIPGPVSMMGGDNTMTRTKSGEYILPVEAVMGLGVRMGATTHGDALAIGKHILDKEVMGLKKEMGNNTPPRNSGISTGADQASPTPGQGVGFAEGGIISDATQWLGSHVVDPLKNMMTPKPGIPVGSTPPLQPQQVGSGYLNRTGTGLQSHNSAVEQVARDTGYAEGGGVGNWLSEHVVQPVKSALTPKPGIPASPSSTALGTGYARNTADTVKTHNQAVTDAAKGYAEGGMPDNQFIPVEKQPIVAPHGAEGSFELPPPKPGIPAPAATTPPGPASPPPAPSGMGIAPDPHGSAQIGKQKVNYGDIGVMGKDPLAGKSTGSVNTMTGEEFQRSGLAADPNFGKTGMEYNTATKTWGKPDPEIMVGNPNGIMSTMKESEAYNKGLMNPQQRQSYEARQMQEKELQAKTDIAKGTMGIKQEEADTKKTAAESLAAYHKQLGDAKTNFGKGVMSSLSPEAVHDLASQFAKTGQMPAMGMGGMADREAIFNEWSKMMHTQGGTLNDQLEQRAALKASQGALNNDVKQYDLMEKSEKQAAGAAKLLRESSKNYGRTGVRFVNSMEALTRNAVNDPKLADLQMKLLAFTREYYKITTNAYASVGELSRGAQEQADKLLNASDSYESLDAKIRAAEQEIANTKGTFKETIDARKKDISSVGKELTPDIAAQYKAKYGDRAKAEAAAKADGYTF